MKKLFSLILIIVNISCFAQAKKWFVSFSVTPTVGGPSASLKKQMNDQHFNDASTSSILFFGWTTQYPRVIKDVALLARGGAQLNDRRSLYFVVGRSGAGTVDGFKKEGSFDWWLIGGTTGQSVSVDYSSYQFTAGYLYSLPHSRMRIGFGPSFFLLDYSITENNAGKQSHSALSPGATFTTRVPLGKEKKLVGLEFLFEGNAAAPVSMKGDLKETGFQPGKVSMFSANVGIAVSFRK